MFEIRSCEGWDVPDGTLNFTTSSESENKYLISCGCCGNISLVNGTHKRYCPVCGPYVITPIAVKKAVRKDKEDKEVLSPDMTEKKKWLIIIKDCKATDEPHFCVFGSKSQIKRHLIALANDDWTRNNRSEGLKADIEIYEHNDWIRARNYYDDRMEYVALPLSNDVFLLDDYGKVISENQKSLTPYMTPHIL